MISEVEQERRKGTFIPIFFLLYIYTTVGPPKTADLGTEEKAAVFGNRRYLGGGTLNKSHC